MYIYIYICTYVQYMYIYICTHITYIIILIASLGAGFKHFVFSPLFGEIVQFDYSFLDGLKPSTSTVDGSELLHHLGCIKP